MSPSGYGHKVIWKAGTLRKTGYLRKQSSIKLQLGWFAHRSGVYHKAELKPGHVTSRVTSIGFCILGQLEAEPQLRIYGLDTNILSLWYQWQGACHRRP